MTKTTPTIKADGSNTYHRDGTVSTWDIHNQSWVRTDRPSDRVLASMSPGERARTMRHCSKSGLRPWTITATDSFGADPYDVDAITGRVVAATAEEALDIAIPKLRAHVVAGGHGYDLDGETAITWTVYVDDEAGREGEADFDEVVE